ncbi:aldolase [Bordetella sp. H567]|uniref:class II aldolase/adducin family protein n=1 Tax=Bordetella sp. H567 TaxID=1697043 RepID=UPI00081D3066|nr:aldolase [Bordetella sp. H567]AOB30281.1 aldolase [Bordetella sp. H567]
MDTGLKSLREELCRAGRSLFERGYVHGTTGNISARVPAADGGGFLITPTDASLGCLEPARLAWVGEDGVQRDGDRASKTLALHRRIYQAAPHAGCVLHTHSRHLVALTLRGVWRDGDILPPLTPYQVMKVGHVPLVPYCRPGDSAVAEHVAHLIADHARDGRTLRAVMCDRLGPQVWHETPAAAMAVLEELEETAALWILADGLAQPLDDARIDELRRHFGAQW